MYARMKEIAAKEAAVLAPRSEVEAKLDCGVVPVITQALARSEFR
jgi:hypothetical protein